MKHKGYRCLLSEKQYLKIIAANVINRFGDSIDAIAFTWLVFQLTGSAAWSGVMFGVNMIPTVILQPLCGGIVERLRKKGVMIWCDVARGVLVCGIAALYILKWLTPWVLLATTFAISCFEAFRVPAGIAIVPKLLSKEHYDYGTSLNSSLSQLFTIIGTGIAGAIIGFLGVQAAIFIDAFTFFMSGLIIGFVKYEDKISDEKLNFTNYFNTMKAGFVYIKTSKTLILICVLGALTNFLTCPFNSFLTPYIVDTLGATSNDLSIISVFLSIGIMLGSFCFPFVSKVVNCKWQFLLTFIGSGFIYFMFALTPHIAHAVSVRVIITSVAMLFFGVIAGFSGTAIGVLLMKKAHEDYMARVAAVFNSSVCAVLPVTSFILSAMAVKLNILWIFVITAVVTIIITIILSGLKTMNLLSSEENTNENTVSQELQLS